MKAAPLLLVALAGCAKIFGLSDPSLIDAPAGAGDAPLADTPDGHVDLPDAAPGHCATIADCPTSVCLPSTVCAADTDVAWLSATGTLGGTCTMAMPCLSLGTALNTNKPYIRVHGKVTNLTTVSQDVAIFAEPGASFANNNLTVSSGTVGVYDLELTSCVRENGGTLTLEHVYIHNCTDTGIIASGPLTLDGSTIALNRNGGVSVQIGPFSITNNVIYANNAGGGGGGGMAGGIYIAAPSGANSRVDFNTVVGNNTKSTGSSGGLFCNIPGFTATGNVLADNLLNSNPGAATANANGACASASSVIQSGTNLGFVNPAGGDFHIVASSSLRDAAPLTTGPATDLDGESRPYGSGYDIGADEYHP